MHTIHYTRYLLLISVFLFSCGDTKEQVENESNAKVTIERVSEKTASKTKDKQTNKSKYIKNNMERLATLTPLTETEFMAWRPEKLMGLPTTNVNTYGPLNVAMFDITYQANDEKVRLHIVDGAGERGSQLTGPAHLIAFQDANQKIPMGYIKTVTENGITAKERYAQVNEEYQLDFLYDDRLYVKVKTTNLGREKTWQAVEAFHFETLLNNNK